MDISPIAFAIPVFIVLIGLELLIAKMRHMEVYRYHDTITDLSCGVGSVVLGAGTKAAGLIAYTVAWEHLALLEFEASIPAWIAAFVIFDLCFYVFHRASHRVNSLWAGHVVHHQSEEYNLSVALRQAWYLPLIDWVFYVPMAILGFSPILYFTARTFNLLYQFWIHTEVVRTIGPFEWVLNTPSHHRVHHGQNPEYIDTNYGGMFIVWDRLFGTFEPEVVPAVYGTIAPFQSWNPLWANIVHWKKIAERVSQAKGISTKLHIVFGPPGWTPDGELPAPEISRETQVKFDSQSRAGMDLYVGLNYVLAIVATTTFMVYEHSLGWQELSALGSIILAGLIGWGGLFQDRKWSVALEIVRLLVTPAAFYFAFLSAPLAIGLGVLSVVSAIGLALVYRNPSPVAPMTASPT